MQLITKEIARSTGQKYFFTGVPCNHGHVVTRFVSDGTCTECRRIKSKEWYSDKEYGAEKQRRWRSSPENKKREKEARQDRRQKDPEKHREYTRKWDAANPDAAKAKHRRWYQKNVDQQRARALVYRNANIDHVREYSRSYNKRNRPKVAALARKRRARQKGNGGSHTAVDVLDIFKMQRGKCAICRFKLNKKYHVDHIVPLASGGSNDRRNLQILCAPCNQSKSARDPIAFMRMRGMLL